MAAINASGNAYAGYPPPPPPGWARLAGKTSKDDDKKINTDVPVANFSLADKKLLESGKFSDAKIVANGKTYCVHKNILSTRSEWFRAAFESGFREGNSSLIEISAPDNIDRLLEFVYTGAVDLSKQSKKSKTMASANELSALGDFYKVEALKHYAEQVLGKYLGEHLVSISATDVYAPLPVEYLGPPTTPGQDVESSGEDNYALMKEAGFFDRLCDAIRDAYATPSGIHHVYVAFVCAARAHTFQCQLIRNLRGEIGEFGDDLLTAMMNGLSCSAFEGNEAFEKWKDTLSVASKPVCPECVFLAR